MPNTRQEQLEDERSETKKEVVSVDDVFERLDWLLGQRDHIDNMIHELERQRSIQIDRILAECGSETRSG